MFYKIKIIKKLTLISLIINHKTLIIFAYGQEHKNVVEWEKKEKSQRGEKKFAENENVKINNEISS